MIGRYTADVIVASIIAIIMAATIIAIIVSTHPESPKPTWACLHTHTETSNYQITAGGTVYTGTASNIVCDTWGTK